MRFRPITLATNRLKAERCQAGAKRQRIQQAPRIAGRKPPCEPQIHILQGRQARHQADAGLGIAVRWGADTLDACCIARQPAPGCARHRRSWPTLPVCGSTGSSAFKRGRKWRECSSQHVTSGLLHSPASMCEHIRPLRATTAYHCKRCKRGTTPACKRNQH